MTRGPLAGVRVRNNPGSVRTPAPALGSATREVLAELGYEGERLDALTRPA